MLPISNIQEAVGELLSARFPGEQIYQNLAPADFAHPSFLVECGPVKMTDAGYTALDITTVITVTAFAAVGEFYNSQMAELAQRMMAILELFSVGYLQMNDRALHVTSNEGTYDSNVATVKVTLSYVDDRPVEETFATMGEIHTTIKEEK